MAQWIARPYSEMSLPKNLFSSELQEQPATAAQGRLGPSAQVTLATALHDGSALTGCGTIVSAFDGSANASSGGGSQPSSELELVDGGADEDIEALEPQPRSEHSGSDADGLTPVICVTFTTARP